jgi:NitT/TauT family transport system ATP-binding protein
MSVTYDAQPPPGGDTGPEKPARHPPGDVEPAVGLSGVGKRFADGTLALDGVDLNIARGEFVAIVGPSGCGKTSLLRIISGLDRQSTGEAVRPAEKIAYVFQEPTLLPWLTVRGNVELVALLGGVPRRERRSRAVEAIAQVGLSDFQGHRPHRLSGGMRMRAALAQALTTRPQLFLFDEPFGAADEMTRNRLCDQLQELYMAKGFTALFVTHSIAEAVYLSRRVVVMSPRPGRVVADIDVPMAFPRPPSTRYSAQFADIAGEVAEHLRDAVTDDRRH